MPKELKDLKGLSAHVNLDFGGTMKFKGDAAQVCVINAELLDEEMQQHPGTFSWFAVLAACAARTLTEAEDELKIVMADRYEALRVEAEKMGWKTTEDKLKHMVNATAGVIEQRAIVVRAQYDVDVARGMLEAYKQRKDLLVCLANDRRSEVKLGGMGT